EKSSLHHGGMPLTAAPNRGRVRTVAAPWLETFATSLSGGVPEKNTAPTFSNIPEGLAIDGWHSEEQSTVAGSPKSSPPQSSYSTEMIPQPHPPMTQEQVASPPRSASDARSVSVEPERRPEAKMVGVREVPTVSHVPPTDIGEPMRRSTSSLGGFAQQPAPGI